MSKHYNLEKLSSGLKAKLDATYRRFERQSSETAEFIRKPNPKVNRTTLPFTTKTRAYGTYVWRNSS